MLNDAELLMIGGSDAAAIVGEHPYKSAIDVFRRIKEGHKEEAGPQAKRGWRMEPVIRAIAAEDLGLKLLGPRKLRDPRRPYIRASLDDVADGLDSEEVVELKSVSHFAASDYGHEDDEFPMHHNCQVQFYMREAKLPRANLIALIGLDDVRHYIVAADSDVQEMLADAVDRFYVDHIKTGRPPPPDSSESYSDWLRSRYPKDSGKMLAPTPEAIELVRRMREIKAEIEQAKETEQALRNRLEVMLGGASGFEGLCTHKWSKGRASVDVEALCAEAKIPRALLEKHTKRNPFPVLKLKSEAGQ